MLADRLRLDSLPPAIDGLVAWYTMDLVSGANLIDSAGAHTGTIVGAVQVPGKIGSALQFNGSSNYVDISSVWGEFLTANAPFTLSCWAKHDSTIGQQDIVGIFVFNRGGFRIVSDGAVTYAQIEGVSSRTTGVISPAITIGVFVHYVITFDETGTLRHYKDGALSGSSPGAWVVPSITGRHAKIGAESDDAGVAYRFFDGLIDDVRVYTRALSGVEIADLYSEAL